MQSIHLILHILFIIKNLFLFEIMHSEYLIKILKAEFLFN